MLRTFGCIILAHVPKEYGQELDAKVVKCLFVGYTNEHRSYILYGANNRKLILSRDIVWNEYALVKKSSNIQQLSDFKGEDVVKYENWKDNKSKGKEATERSNSLARFSPSGSVAHLELVRKRNYQYGT